MAEPAVEVPVTVYVDTYLVKLGCADELLDNLKNAVATHLSSLPGFVAAHIYVSRDATKVVSQLEWSDDVSVAEMPEIDFLRTSAKAQGLIENADSIICELCYSQLALIDAPQAPRPVEIRESLRAGDNWRTAP